MQKKLLNKLSILTNYTIEKTKKIVFRLKGYRLLSSFSNNESNQFFEKLFPLSDYLYYQNKKTTFYSLFYTVILVVAMFSLV